MRSQHDTTSPPSSPTPATTPPDTAPDTPPDTAADTAPVAEGPAGAVATGTGRSRLARLLAPIVTVAAAAVAAVTAVGLVGGGTRLPVLLGLGGLIGVGLVVLAITNIEAFVLVVLVMRASLDALKLPAGSPAGLDPAAVLAVLFTVVALLWLLASRREEPRPPLSPLAKALLAFIAAAFLGVFVASHPLVALVEWARIASIAPMLLLVERLATRGETARRVLVAVYASSVVPLLFAGYQFATDTGVFVAGGFDRVRGTFVHSNPFGVFLTMLVVMAVALLPHTRRLARAGLVVFLTGALPALLATYTRGAWIATLIGLVVVGLLQSRRLLIGLLAGVCAVAIAVPSVGARFADLSEPVQDNGTPGNSLSWRWQYWTEAVQLSKESPVSGIGLKMVAAEADEGKQPHNDIIRAYVELGVLGLLAYVGLLVAFVRTAMAGLRAARRRRGPSLDRGIAVGFAGVVIAFIVLSLVANVMSQVVLLWYFLALAGLTLTVVNRDAGTQLAEGHTAERESSANSARQ